ncbi:MAG: amidase [Pseudomonadales bacterium]
MNPPELCRLSARTQRELVARGELSCEELLKVHLQWIEAVNPEVNAICTLVPEAALEQARAADKRLAGGAEARPLEGLPIAIKDLVNTRGIRTTYGSPLFRDHVPDTDALHVSRIRAAGGVVIGKTNTPEWGAGSQTFNTLFGATATPFDTTRTAGGSSGGAAAALAARMLPVADGSDLGGSLRNPAAFCNVVGFRPSPGRVADPARLQGWNPLPVLGPLARSVDDAVLLLSVMAGADQHDPLTLDTEPGYFETSLDSDPSGLRVAWSADLGFLPVARSIREVFEDSVGVFEVLGCLLEEAAPDLRDGPDIFQTLRAHMFLAKYADYFENLRDQIKDTVQWNTRKGLEQSVLDVAMAEVAHRALYRRVVEFWQRFDFLILPATQLPPFSKELDWVREIEGVQFENYLQWMEICTVISLTGCPAISVPGGFTAEGLPVGLQIVGPPRCDLEVLRLAHAFEQATGYAEREPDYQGPSEH